MDSDGDEWKDPSTPPATAHQWPSRSIASPYTMRPGDKAAHNALHQRRNPLTAYLAAEITASLRDVTPARFHDRVSVEIAVPDEQNFVAKITHVVGRAGEPEYLIINGNSLNVLCKNVSERVLAPCHAKPVYSQTAKDAVYVLLKRTMQPEHICDDMGELVGGRLQTLLAMAADRRGEQSATKARVSVSIAPTGLDDGGRIGVKARIRYYGLSEPELTPTLERLVAIPQSAAQSTRMVDFELTAPRLSTLLQRINRHLIAPLQPALVVPERGVAIDRGGDTARGGGRG